MYVQQPKYGVRLVIAFWSFSLLSSETWRNSDICIEHFLSIKTIPALLAKSTPEPWLILGLLEADNSLELFVLKIYS
jgi:hypothetical protein